MKDEKQTNTPINKRQGEINNVIIDLLVKTSKIQQLLTTLLDGNNYYNGEYPFDDFNILPPDLYKRLQDIIVSCIQALGEQVKLTMDYQVKQQLNETKKEE